MFKPRFRSISHAFRGVSRPEEIDGSWSRWLQGRPPSPGAQSMAGDDEDDALSVVSERRRSVGSVAPRSSVVAQLAGGQRKRQSCSLP